MESLRFCPVYTPRGERLHVFSQHARFLGSSYILPNFRFARRCPKETPPHFLPQNAPSLNNHSSTTLQPQPNQPRYGRNQPPLNHNNFTTISPTIQQPLSNPAPTIGNLNPIHNRPSAATQPRANHSHASFALQSHSSRPKPTDGRFRAWQTPTTQPSFVSNPRTIPTQPSSIRDSPNPTQPQPQQSGGRISPDDRREEPRDSPATKSSGCLSARCTCGEAVRSPDERSEELCEAKSQEGAREPRRVSTDRRSLPKAVARVVPQGAERALCGVQICRAPRFSHNRVVGSHTAMHTGRRTSPNGELPPRRWSYKIPTKL